MGDVESSLLLLAKAGLRGPHGEFWEHFQAAWPLLERFAKVRVARLGVAADLRKDCIQEFFRRVCKYRLSYRGSSEGELWAWLGKILNNARLDVVRQEARQTNRKIVLDIPIAERNAQENESERADEFAALEVCLAKLEPDQRLVIQLRYFEPKMTVRGTAAALARSAGWVSKLEQKALRMLLECLQSNENESRRRNSMFRADAV